MNIIVDIGGETKALTIREAKNLCNKMLNSVKEFDLTIDGKEYKVYPCEAKKICKGIHEQLYI